MTNTNRLQSKCLKLFITLFIILSSNPSTVNSESETLFLPQINCCKPNAKGNIIFSFNTTKTNKPKIIDPTNSSRFILVNRDDTSFDVELNKDTNDSSFSFNITLNDSFIIAINGTFVNCPDSKTPIIVIAFLASLCLILFTALALTLIILRRKKPITFKFGQKEDKDCDRNQFSDNFDENYENHNKNASIDVTNTLTPNTPSIVVESPSPRLSQPRKSSLKPSSKSVTTDQLNNNFSAHENGAFNGTELEVVNEDNEEKEKIEEKPSIGEPRRKSIVTFSETTQVKYG